MILTVNSVTKRIALRRVNTLLGKASDVNSSDPSLARSYVWTARKIAMAARTSIPRIYSRRICRKCNSLLIPGQSGRVRIKSRRQTHLVITCLNCGYVKRIPLSHDKEEEVNE